MGNSQRRSCRNPSIACQFRRIWPLPCCGGTPWRRYRRDGAGLAVRRLGPGAGALPALHPRDELPAADPAVVAPVRAADQRGCLGRRCSAAPSRGSTTKPRPSSRACAAPGSFAPTRPRCGSTAGPVGTGCSRTTRTVIHVNRPSRGRAVVAGGAGRAPAGDLGVRPLERPARPCRPLAGLYGAPAARPGRLSRRAPKPVLRLLGRSQSAWRVSLLAQMAIMAADEIRQGTGVPHLDFVASLACTMPNKGSSP